MTRLGSHLARPDSLTARPISARYSFFVVLHKLKYSHFLSTLCCSVANGLDDRLSTSVLFRVLPNSLTFLHFSRPPLPFASLGTANSLFDGFFIFVKNFAIKIFSVRSTWFLPFYFYASANVCDHSCSGHVPFICYSVLLSLMPVNDRLIACGSPLRYLYQHSLRMTNCSSVESYHRANISQWLTDVSYSLPNFL